MPSSSIWNVADASPDPADDRMPLNSGCSRFEVRSHACNENVPACVKGNDPVLPEPTDKAWPTFPGTYVAMPVHVAAVPVISSRGLTSPVSQAVRPANGETGSPRLTA